MESTTEEWRPITTEGYEGLYEVSDLGRVRSSKRIIQAKNRVVNYKTRSLKQNIDSGGYPQVTLCNHNKRKTVMVHKLVLEAFGGPRPEGMEVCHDDGVRVHNHPHNLYWGTRRDNILDKYRHGTHNWMDGYKPITRKELRQKSKDELDKYMGVACCSEE